MPDFVVSMNSDGSIDKATTIRRAELYKKLLKSNKELEDKMHTEERRNKIAKSLLAAIVLAALAVLLWFMGG